MTQLIVFVIDMHDADGRRLFAGDSDGMIRMWAATACTLRTAVLRHADSSISWAGEDVTLRALLQQSTQK
eukprot:1192603-Prorocentrum_minimum.AAC.2